MTVWTAIRKRIFSSQDFSSSRWLDTEYQANLFAADLLIDDEEIEDMVQNEDLDYFGLCSSLNATPELMSFKLYSLTKRGQAYHMPMEIQSNFLAK